MMIGLYGMVELNLFNLMMDGVGYNADQHPDHSNYDVLAGFNILFILGILAGKKER